jgi:YHS domain-containing protein
MKSMFSTNPFIFFPVLFIFLIGCGKKDEATLTADDFYPIDFCIVSGSDFDEEGTGMVPFMYVHEGISLKFCCKPCLPKFKKDPEKFLVILEEEMEYLKQEKQKDG